PNDKDLVEKLKGMKLDPPDVSALFATDTSSIDTGLVKDTITYYADINTLYARVSEFVRLAEADQKKAAPGTNMGQLGAVIRAGKEQPAPPPTIQIVELGLLMCEADKKGAAPQPNPQCPPAKVVGVQFRPDNTNAAWGSLPIAKADAFGADQVLAFSPSPL